MFGSKSKHQDLCSAPEPEVPKLSRCLRGSDALGEGDCDRGKLNDTLTISVRTSSQAWRSICSPWSAATCSPTPPWTRRSRTSAWPGISRTWRQIIKARSQPPSGPYLLDQIFGFDPDQSNPNPINTFHLGFWFNDPNDANTDGCTFDVTKPTPFNGEHNAGPVAFISVPNATTNLGPLCTDPNNNTVPVSCNP